MATHLPRTAPSARRPSYRLSLLVLGLSGLVFPVTLSLAALGIVFAVLGLRNVRRYPDEVTGQTVASLGLVACTCLLIGGSAMHTYTYLTEVPDGYMRISFEDLQGKEDPQTGEPVPPRQLDGQRDICKGIRSPWRVECGGGQEVHPRARHGYLLFRRPTQDDRHDRGDGCRCSRRTLQSRKRKLGGILHVSERIRKVAGDLTGGLYELRADYVK